MDKSCHLKFCSKTFVSNREASIATYISPFNQSSTYNSHQEKISLSFEYMP